MDLRELQQHCEAILRAHWAMLLELRPEGASFDPDGFCRRLGEHRGRPMVLVPFESLPDEPSGFWVERQHVDEVWYEHNTSGYHRQTIIAHEVGHMLAGHRGVALNDEEYLQHLAPALSPAAFDRMGIRRIDGDGLRLVLERHDYSDWQEQEAEMIATLLVHRIFQPVSAPRAVLPPHLAEVVRRLEAALEEPGGAWA